jgi:hypothetical protein
MRLEVACWGILGMFELDVRRRREILEEFKADSEAG